MERARTEIADHLAVATRSYGADFDRRVQSVARLEPARLLDPRVTLEELPAMVPAGGSDGQR